MTMRNVRLGRRLLLPLQGVVTQGEDACADESLRKMQEDDRFFCETMELIPAQYYFPTDEEENWRKSAPKKYHRDVLSQKQQQSSKNALKRAKFNPNEQKTNEQRQLDAAEEEQRQRQQQQVKLQAAKDPSAVSIEGLKERLAAKVNALREKRKAGEQPAKKRKTDTTAASKNATASRKRKATAISSTGATKKSHVDSQSNGTSANGAAANGTPASDNSDPVSADAISYGSLLLADEPQPTKAKTRNGQGVRNIKNLLKKAERNKQRMEELKKTEEGKALLQAKGWDKAIKQAAGEAVLDDPKLLRRKLKKKEKQKTKSAKEWGNRKTQLEMQKKDKQKTRLENLRGGKKDRRKERESTPRAGFEGKKGGAFLNAEKK